MSDEKRQWVRVTGFWNDNNNDRRLEGSSELEDLLTLLNEYHQQGVKRLSWSFWKNDPKTVNHPVAAITVTPWIERPKKVFKKQDEPKNKSWQGSKSTKSTAW